MLNTLGPFLAGTGFGMALTNLIYVLERAN